MSGTVKSSKNVVATNKKARHNYFIEETFEAGIVLHGSEVKSLRMGKANIIDSHASIDNSEAFLHNAYIPEYKQANRFNHQPRQPRKLLLHKNEIKKLTGKVQRQGYTLVALSIYFNAKNMAKVELGLAKGKKQHDKRQSDKERDWNRDKQRMMKRDY